MQVEFLGLQVLNQFDLALSQLGLIQSDRRQWIATSDTRQHLLGPWCCHRWLRQGPSTYGDVVTGEVNNPPPHPKLATPRSHPGQGRMG